MFGGFDENIPCCEDYDLWLKITAQCNVGLLAENLVTRYEGHHDQLSHSFFAMDRFRIYSFFSKILSLGIITSNSPKDGTVDTNYFKISLNASSKTSTVFCRSLSLWAREIKADSKTDEQYKLLLLKAV